MRRIAPSPSQSARRRRSLPLGGASLVVLAITILPVAPQIAGCGTEPITGAALDASVHSEPMPRALPLEPPPPVDRTSGMYTTPAPAVDAPARAPSGALTCAFARPAGDCDRCPERPCRQVRVLPPPSNENGDAWAMFCEQGDLREEARIACLCAGGDARGCDAAAADTARALGMVDTIFGGEVPAVGTRYRDGYGLRAVVDEDLHAWLAASAAPAFVIRCDEADREGATARYEVRAQRVRTTGSCAPTSE